jgi:Rhodopirellula transposase DDE domain
MIDLNPSVAEALPSLEQNFLAVLRDHIAGDPMRQEVRWTDLTRRQISRRMAERGTPAGKRVVKQLLKQHGYVKRKAQKSRTMGRRHPDRNAQFEKIARLKQEYLEAGDPVVSIDTKKKELLGNFYREGKLYTQETIAVFDHDFPSAASGVVIPHGLYDVGLNRGHINLGTSHETSQFACESIEQWWRRQGRNQYPRATRLLLLCDGGGSNSASQYLFKEDLEKLADRIGVEIRVAHYPPYCSKYNPIEHRLFPHVTRACQGVVFHTVELVKGLIEKTTTAKGLEVSVDIMDKVYETGRKCAAGFKQNMKIVFDELLPKWNYRAIPSTS